MRFLVIVLVLLAVAATAGAQTTDDITGVIFKEAEKRIIEKYFGAKAAKADEDEDDDGAKDKKKKKNKDKKGKKGKKGKDGEMPPGLAKKDELPPGLAKQLERNGTLPPGLAKRDLPPDLAARLPPPAPGHQRVIVEDDVVLIDQATGIILDILADVVK